MMHRIRHAFSKAMFCWRSRSMERINCDSELLQLLIKENEGLKKDLEQFQSDDRRAAMHHALIASSWAQVTRNEEHIKKESRELVRRRRFHQSTTRKQKCS